MNLCLNLQNFCPMNESSIIEIGDILVSSEVVTEYFSCNYEECRGACCIIGESGAPLQEEEASLLERDYPQFKKWMSPEGCRKAEECGFFEIDRDGDMVTPLIGNGEECAYTRFEEGGCFCAVERCHSAGQCKFVKPISCRLYPIRAKIFSNGITALNLHRWDICKGAFAKGKKEGIRVYEFLKIPLTDAYGEQFYEALCGAAKMVNGI